MIDALDLDCGGSRLQLRNERPFFPYSVGLEGSATVDDVRETRLVHPLGAYALNMFADNGQSICNNLSAIYLVLAEEKKSQLMEGGLICPPLRGQRSD